MGGVDNLGPRVGDKMRSNSMRRRKKTNRFQPKQKKKANFLHRDMHKHTKFEKLKYKKI